MNKSDSTTEQQILETAEELFLEKGFAMTSTVEIAKKVGCNQALVHYYYRTKDKLFEMVFEKKIRLFISTFSAIDDSLSFEEKLTHKIEAHFDILQKNPKIPFLLFNEFLTNKKRLRSFGERIIEHPKALLTKLTEELNIEIKKGTIRSIEPIDLMLSIISLNVTLFLATPIFKEVLKLSDKEINAFYEKRKKEHVRIILASLKP